MMSTEGVEIYLQDQAHRPPVQFSTCTLSPVCHWQVISLTAELLDWSNRSQSMYLENHAVKFEHTG